MSINYYQEMPGGEYANRLMRWYDGCKWEVRRLEGPKESRRMVQRIWTPTPLEIAVCVLGKRNVDTARGDSRGEKSATKLMRQLRLRILKCTVESMPLPRDIVLSAARHASAPQGFTDKNGRWQEGDWRLALSVACALIRKEQADKREEEIDVKLNEDNHDRSYLYGRLLALADMVEYSAMDKNAYRQTNAIRYMQIFQQRPFEIWPRLHTLIQPYMGKLGGYSERYKKLIGQVEERFMAGDRESREPLDGKYLQGYYCQRQALFTKKDEAKGADTHDDSEE
jgi:CRISPR-associated protein Csd1